LGFEGPPVEVEGEGKKKSRRRGDWKGKEVSSIIGSSVEVPPAVVAPLTNKERGRQSIFGDPRARDNAYR
jgi:hypothetical protein